MLDKCSVDFHAATVNVLIGISGSGKSTLLSLIAGRVQPNCGSIYLFSGSNFSQPRENSDQLVEAGAEQLVQKSALVPQSGGVYPDETVAKNLKLALSRSGWNKSDQHEQMTRVIQLCQLESLQTQRCSELSGGECHRVALARGLIKSRPVLLLDEPLSHTDVGLRESLKAAIVDKAKREGRTIIYVTHDPVEAMSIADSISILDQGRVIQSGSPEVVFETPASSQAMRLLSVWPVNQILPVDFCKFQSNQTSDVFIRADDLRLANEKSAFSAEIEIRIDSIRSVAGKMQLRGVTKSGSSVAAVLSTDAAMMVGEDIRLGSNAVYQF